MTQIILSCFLYMLTFHLSPTPLTTIKVGRSKILNPHKQISLNFLWELIEWLIQSFYIYILIYIYTYINIIHTFFYLKLILYMSVHWKDWCWSWNSNTLATSCEEELTHWKIPWCWEGLESGGEGNDRGWDGWMASTTRWTWVWVNSRSWWWTGRPDVLRFMGSQRASEWLNWTELNWSVWWHHEGI